MTPPAFPAAPGLAESPTVLDITANTLSVSYSSGTGIFSVSSQFSLPFPNATVFLNDDSNSSYDISGSPGLTISLEITPSGALNGPGTLTITGNAYGGNSGNLLTGSISQFNFPNSSQGSTLAGGEEFQFIFNTTGGDLASYYPSIAVDLEEVDTNFNGTFASFDDESGNAQTDNYAAPAPEPAALTLACLGVLVFVARFVILRGTRMLCGSPRG
jgi:hypothetical protein